MAEWRAIKLEKSLGEWRNDWNRLNKEIYDEHPLFDARFLNCLLKHFGTGNERLLVCIENGQPVGMTIVEAKPFGIWHSFLPSQLQVAPVLASDASLLSGIFNALPFSAWQITFLCQDPNFSPFSVHRDRRIPTIFTQHAVTMHVDLNQNFDDYWNDRSSKLRQNIRRYKSRAVKDRGKCQIEKITDKEKIRPAVVRYGDLESSGWKGRSGTAVHIDNSQGKFYCDLLETFAESDQSCVYEYCIGGQIAASRLLIRNSKMAIALKTTYDERNRKYSPGRVLLYEVLRRETTDYAAQETVEFYTDATDDQLQWSSGERSICHVSLFRNRVFLVLQRLMSLRHLLKKIFRRPGSD